MSYKIAVLGGDRRQLAAADEWKKRGATTALFGFDTYDSALSSPLDSVLDNASAVLLPIPIARGGRLNMPYSENEPPAISEVINSIPESVSAVCGGMFTPEIHETLKSRGCHVFDLCKSERFSLLNAVPTVEGSIEIAMTHLPTTLHGSNAAVLGFGRIGSLLCRNLALLGVRVTVAARSERDLTLAEVYGYNAVTLSGLLEVISDMDIVFNTIPSIVITEDYLKRLPKSSPIIDLASRPGGVDTSASLRLGSKVITALSLPGKVAPESAGKIITRCMSEFLSEVMS